jgi:hypothetical protein
MGGFWLLLTSRPGLQSAVNSTPIDNGGIIAVLQVHPDGKYAVSDQPLGRLKDLVMQQRKELDAKKRATSSRRSSD